MDYQFRHTGSSFPTAINTAIDEGFNDNVVVATAQEGAGTLPVEDAKVRIKQNNLFIKVDTMPNVTEITIVWGINWFWIRVNYFRIKLCFRVNSFSGRMAHGSTAVQGTDTNMVARITRSA